MISRSQITAASESAFLVFPFFFSFSILERSEEPALALAVAVLL